MSLFFLVLGCPANNKPEGIVYLQQVDCQLLNGLLLVMSKEITLSLWNGIF
jgi:hypothetical protein